MLKEELYKSFKNEINDLEIWDYNEFDNNLKNYILSRKCNLERFKSEEELKKYLSKWIHLFRESIFWKILEEELWLNYDKKISEEFHKKYIEIIQSWKSENWYEDTVNSFN